MAISHSIALLALMVGAATASADFRRLAGCDDKHEDMCKCALGCEVMGEDSSKCSDNKEDNDKAIAEKTAGMMTDKTKMCDLIKCSAYCANAQDCLDDSFKTSCENYKKAATDCDVDCSDANPRAILGITAFLLAVAMQF